GRGRRGDRPGARGAVERGPAIRGVHERGRLRAQDPARRLRAGRRVVSHRGPHATGRGRLLLFRRPYRRHVPLEGRERRDLGGRGGDLRLPRRQGSPRLWRGPSRDRRPGRYGRPRGGEQMRSETIAIHAGYDVDPTTKSVAVPIYQTVAYAFDSADHGAALFNLEVDGFRYSRISNPTTAVLERRVTALEGGV